MKKYLICLFIFTVLFGFSCATAPDTPAPVTQTATAPPPAATPPPVAAPPPVTTYVPPAPQPVLDPNGLDMSGAADYTVIPGDFLSEITRTFYGNLTGIGTAGTRNGFYFPVLMLASDGQITDPDLIYPDMKLKIPDLIKNLANPDSRRTIKNLLAQVAILYRNRSLPDEAEGLQKLADWL